MLKHQLRTHEFPILIMENSDLNLNNNKFCRKLRTAKEMIQ